MKRFNKNIILFVAVCLVLISGFSKDSILYVSSTVKYLFIDIFSGDSNYFDNFKNSLDRASSELLNYHDQLIDINSVKENLVGTRIIKKDDSYVIKSDSGSLIEDASKIISNKEMTQVVDRIAKLKAVAEENDAKFLYLAAPNKEIYEIAPVNAINNSKINFDNFMNKLSSKNIPFLDFRKSLKENNIADDQIYFYTDHHWKPNSGFIANKSICEELSSRYGFEYNKKYIDINNYNIKTYKDYFLGSRGKKVGTYFSWHGADDFDLITPKFKTDFIENQPFKKESRTGDFKNTVLFLENIERKDFYNLIPYSTYCGGDFRLQIIKNNLNPDGKKILLIRDSFASVVAPFLSLQTNELHMIDMRNYEYFVGDKINTYEYIKKIKPDYVLVLYQGINNMKNSSGRYDFD